jgi:hypothetical protein
MAGIEHPGNKEGECDPYDDDKRQASRFPAILTDPPWEKGKEVVRQAEKVDKHREKDEIKQNARIKGSQSADRLFENRRLSPLQAVPQEKGVGKWEIENEYEDPEYARSGHCFPAPPEEIDIPRQVENIRNFEEHRCQPARAKGFYEKNGWGSNLVHGQKIQMALGYVAGWILPPRRICAKIKIGKSKLGTIISQPQVLSLRRQA